MLTFSSEPATAERIIVRQMLEPSQPGFKNLFENHVFLAATPSHGKNP
ncbi:hypothetical protein ASZ90_017775 [hydrocarbon metagenome]|uniref:Uncharacterized protein n=1 Tax=hydrocarbon metagenome TaxID=938273 RepID=A0A0W8E843_9ZZZZ